MAFAKRRLRLAVGLALLVAECAARASLLAGAAPACDAAQPVSLRGRAAQRVGRIVSRTVHALTQHEALQPHVAVFMVGLPGAGKSSVISRRYLTRRTRRLNTTVVVDLDSEMISHPGYDPANARESLEALYLSREAYRWADQRVEERFALSLNETAGLRRVVLDGTGTNAERQVRRMQMARDAGWFVKVVYVRIPVQLAAARATLRKRSVSPAKVAAYQDRIADALAVAGRYADELETVENFFDQEALAVEYGAMSTVAIMN